MFFLKSRTRLPQSCYWSWFKSQAFNLKPDSELGCCGYSVPNLQAKTNDKSAEAKTNDKSATELENHQTRNFEFQLEVQSWACKSTFKVQA